MYVILTSKPGQYRTEAGNDITVLEAWNYYLCGRLRACFQIGELHKETRVRVIEEDESGVINVVPSKFLERFDSYEAARRELDQLCSYGGLDARLEPASATSHIKQA
ncbi:ferredoxin [Bordetella sp. 02P26C-1]|uniref:ferredoxin n=1 Tax=Bordetella sp. 02P26C-1 TaxID=2683195 RepID=UPI0013549E1D|nr:ferredoxin [Bordetella sp. 02P26C-1]MVW78042.1 ferredoxin [Bordetella sp. 02P26C-1]